MIEKFLCARQERCPVVLAACERKVMAESDARLKSAKLAELERDLAVFASKREVMNELYAAGVAMRKAQCVYFKSRSHHDLCSSKSAEARFDRALERCRNLGKPVQLILEAV